MYSISNKKPYKELEKLHNTLKDKVTYQEEELSKSTAYFETIFETVQDGIAILDLESNFLLVNNAYEKITGFSKEYLYTTSCISLTIDSMKERSREIVGIVIEKGYYKNYEKQCIIKDDAIIDVIMDIVLMPDKKSLLLVVKDITEQNIDKKRYKDQEQRLLQNSKMAQMGEMISMIAHQWRQPLSAISTTVVNLQMKIELETFDFSDAKGVAEAKRYFLKHLVNISDFVQNLTNTIDDFRNFYKPNKQIVNTTFQEITIKALHIIGASLANSNVEIIKEYNSNESIKLYDNEMMQVILNLLKNAQDNFKEKRTKNPCIRIVIEKKSISICDNGGGIPEDIMGKIFEPYFSTKDERNGTGLGLYMSKTIIEEHHNGILHVRNTDKGACFKITLDDG